MWPLRSAASDVEVQCTLQSSSTVNNVDTITEVDVTADIVSTYGFQTVSSK